MSAPEIQKDVEGGSLDPLVRALREAGYTVAEGPADVLNLIHAVSDDGAQPLCSGWRMFPDGKRCEGCEDCSPNN